MKININENCARVERHGDNSSYNTDQEIATVRRLLQKNDTIPRISQFASTTLPPDSILSDGLTKQIFTTADTLSEKYEGYQILIIIQLIQHQRLMHSL